MVAAFDRFSGYGNDAVDIALGLDKQGFDVVPFPTAVMPGLDAAFVDLLGKSPTRPPDVALAFLPPFDLRPQVASFGVPTVGWTMWERTPMTPRDFRGHGWRQGTNWRAPLGWLSRLVVTTGMNREAFEPVAGDVPISVVPCGIDADRWPTIERPRGGRPLRFLNVGMLVGRKNPFALLETWRRLTKEVPGWDATLHLHTLAKGLHPAVADGAYGPGITMTTKPLSRPDLLAMYHGADVFVSTSRGEGNNKPPMEFMATGGTVIATDWSGHQNWLHPDVGWPVPGKMVDAPCGYAQECEIDRDLLFDAMVAAWEDRAETSARGLKAARYVRQALSWEAVLPKIGRTLRDAAVSP